MSTDLNIDDNLARLKELSSQLEVVKAELVAQQRRYKSVFDRIPIGMLLLDKDGRIITANRRVFKLLGYTCEELVGKSLEDFIMFPDPHDAVIRQALLDGKISSYPYHRSIIAKDKEVVLATSIRIQIDDTDQKLVFFVSILEENP